MANEKFRGDDLSLATEGQLARKTTPAPVADIPYEYYTDTYFGTAIPEAEWSQCCARAVEIVDYYIEDRDLDDYPGAIDQYPKAVCGVAEVWKVTSKARTRVGLKSEKILGWSASWGDQSEIERSYKSVISKHLENTGILSRWGLG